MAKKLAYMIVVITLIFLMPNHIVYAKTSDNSVYEDIKKKNDEKSKKEVDELYKTMENDESSESEGGTYNIAEVIWEYFFIVHTQLASLFPLLVIGSIILGVMTMIFAKKNKTLYKTGLVTFVIAIPVTLIVVVFFIPQFYIKF